MNILIVGDSFAEYSGEGTWPYFLKNALNANIECVGGPGISNYTILQNFKKHYKENHYNYTFILPTNSARIPTVSVKDKPYLCNWMPWHPLWKTSHNAHIPVGYEDAVESYLRFFFDDDLSKWVSKCAIDDIINSIGENEKVIICRAVYEDDAAFGSIASGIKIKGKLMDYAIRELTEWCHTTWEDHNKKNYGDSRLNHFTSANQEALANFFKNIIEKDLDGTLTDNDLNLDNVKWVTDKNILLPQLCSRSRSK